MPGVNIFIEGSNMGKVKKTPGKSRAAEREMRNKQGCRTVFYVENGTVFVSD